MLHVATAGLSTIQVLLAIVGLVGGGTGITALVKMRGDIDTATVTRAQNAQDMMAVLQRELRDDRDSWKTRAIDAETENRLQSLEFADCRRKLARAEAELQKLRKAKPRT